jgi:hypothetical protein
LNYLRIVLITCGGSFAAIALWFGLFYRNRISEIPTRQLFIIILTVGFTCRVVFALLTPSFYAPDEQAHFKYVKYIVENHSLPVQTSRVGSPTKDWEYYQPPLYYLSLTPLYILSERLFQEELITVRLLRIFSIMLWGITVLFAFKFLRSLNVHDPFLKTFVILITCLLPTYTFLSSVINNDNLLIAVGSGILYLTVQPISFRNSALIGILLGLALLTKLNAVVYIALIMLILVVGLVRRTIGRAAIPYFVLPIIFAMFIWAPWAWRNWNVYGSVTAEEVANVSAQWKTIFIPLLGTFQGMQSSFWAVSGIKNDISFFYPKIGMHIFYFACIGLLLGLFSKRKKLILLVQKNSNIIIASALAVLINVILVFRFEILYGQGQGRFLFPLLIPISLLMGMGLKMFSISDTKNSPIHLTGFFITYVMSFVCLSIAMFPRT